MKIKVSNIKKKIDWYEFVYQLIGIIVLISPMLILFVFIKTITKININIYFSLLMNFCCIVLITYWVINYYKLGRWSGK